MYYFKNAKRPTLRELEVIMNQTGGSLDLNGTQITALPDNLTVGGWLYLSGTQITDDAKHRVRHLTDGDYVPGKYLYADGILTHVKSERKAGEYTLYVGKIKGKNVVSDETYYAHCEDFREGIADLAFKHAKERGAEQYKNLNLDSVMTPEESINMYRIITGACRAGTESFVSGLGKLKDRYTVREIIEITDGQYNSRALREFFGI